MLKIELFSINYINTIKQQTKTKNGSQFALSINGTRSCYQQAALVAPILLH
jgi:hypothetical protein